MFCEPEYTDITCPQPELNSDTDQLAASVEESNCPPSKRASLCQFANIQASQSLFPCCLLITWKCVPLVDLLNTLLRAGQNGLPPTSNTLHLGCSYHLHSSHHCSFHLACNNAEKKLCYILSYLPSHLIF